MTKQILKICLPLFFIGAISLPLACERDNDSLAGADADRQNETETESDVPIGEDGDDGDDGDEARCPDGFHFDEEKGFCLPGADCPEGFLWDDDAGFCLPESTEEPDGDTDDNEQAEQTEAVESEQETGEEEPFVPLPDDFSCEALSLPVRAFEAAEPSTALYATAPDFSIETENGAWRFSEEWTGCETYLFILENPRQASGWRHALWERDVEALLKKLPENTQVFFVPSSADPTFIENALAQVKTQANAYLSTLDDETRSRWHYRLHYVTQSPAMMEGWIQSALTDPRWGIGIDRFQRLRYIGSFADYRRFDQSKEWFAPNIMMAANEAIYYNFEAEREAKLQEHEALVIEAFGGETLSDPGWAGVRGYANVEFPNAETMATFDTLELDLYLGCVGEGEYGDCPAWDYIVHLYLCDEEDEEICDTEIGRWITTYHREGRWVHDISALLPYIANGGNRRVAFYTQQPYEVSLSFRLMNQAKETKPKGMEFLFTGGSFSADYNDKYEPILVTIPEDASRVELATVITGHGMEMPGNCAEFCNTTHHFFVNGTENVLDFPMAGASEDCMDQTASGTVPNQYGTWWYGRSGWCPGKEVPLTITDITSQVTLGAENRFEYEGLFQGEPYSSGAANIRMTSWVVWHE